MVRPAMDEEPFSPDDEEGRYITKAIALFCASTRLAGMPATHTQPGKDYAETMAEETIAMAMMFERYVTEDDHL